MKKIRLTGFFSLLALSALATLSPVFGQNSAYLIVFLLLVYTIFIFRGVGEQPNEFIYFMMVFISSTFLILVVVDPVEIGLYGHDPYRSLSHFKHISVHNPFKFIELHRRPYLYNLSAILRALLTKPYLPVAKYIPLISVLIPLVIFTTLRRRTSVEMAYFGSIFVFTNSYYLLLESKFVPEVIAAVLFYLFIYLILSPNGKKTATDILLGLVVFSIFMSHHFTGFLLVLLLFSLVFTRVLWDKAPMFGGGINESRSYWAVFSLSAILFVAVFLYINTGWMSSLLGIAIDVLSGSISPFRAETVSAASKAAENWLSINIGQLKYAFLALFSVFNIIYFVRNRGDTYNEILSIIGYNGAVSLLFLAFLIFGPVIPLHPSRFWVFLLPTLVIVFIVTISKQRFDHISIQNIVCVVLVVFIFVQLSMIPAHVIKTDVGDTSVDEGHYTTSLREASSWTATYNVPYVIGWEAELWENVTTGTEFFQYGSYRAKQNCHNSLVADRGSNLEEDMRIYNISAASKIYHSDQVSLRTCHIYGTV